MTRIRLGYDPIGLLKIMREVRRPKVPKHEGSSRCEFSFDSRPRTCPLGMGVWRAALKMQWCPRPSVPAQRFECSGLRLHAGALCPGTQCIQFCFLAQCSQEIPCPLFSHHRACERGHTDGLGVLARCVILVSYTSRTITSQNSVTFAVPAI